MHNDEHFSPRRSSSPVSNGRKYFKLLSQLRKQTNPSSLIRRPIVLHRSSPFSTNYFGFSSSFPSNKSIQVDDFDDFSFKTAFEPIDSSISLVEIVLTSISFVFFVVFLLYFQVNSRPLNCLFHRSSIDLSDGFRCDQIEIHFVRIDSNFYQIEIRRNRRAKNCLGFDVLSCSPLTEPSKFENKTIVRHDFLAKFCQNVEQISCPNDSFRFETFWHCSCKNSSLNDENKCFQWKIVDQCQLKIPWLNFCLKNSDETSFCHAEVKNVNEFERYF